MNKNITVIILTYNEEDNINAVLDSVLEVTSNIFVVDSFSTDDTVPILNERGITYTKHIFDNYSVQRNWAQKNDPFNSDWILHLDADEPITEELSLWINNDFDSECTNVDGFMFSRKTIFMGRWIKHGGQYPNFHLRLFRSLKGRCEDKAYDQHFIVNGSVMEVKNADIINTVSPNIDSMILSHNKWASKEALDIVSSHHSGEVLAKLFGNKIERKRWVKVKIFENSPLFIRSFLYFIYRYFIRLGFLDGKQGLVFFTLQSFWFRFLVDAKVYEIKLNLKKDAITK